MNQESFIEELAEEFRLSITHRVTENVDLEDVEQASLDTKFSSSNVGFVFFKSRIGGVARLLSKRMNRSSKYTCYLAYATNFVVLADYYCGTYLLFPLIVTNMKYLKLGFLLLRKRENVLNGMWSHKSFRLVLKGALGLEIYETSLGFQGEKNDCEEADEDQNDLWLSVVRLKARPL
ncbi:unnamed protein product [Cochlearia groenlandica]